VSANILSGAGVRANIFFHVLVLELSSALLSLLVPLVELNHA